jgi:hypothetical protein
MSKFQGSVMRCQRVFVSASRVTFRTSSGRPGAILIDSTHAGHHFPGDWVSFPREIGEILE